MGLYKREKITKNEFLQAVIFSEVQALGDSMMNLCEDLVTLHKVIVPLHDMQKKLWDNEKYLKII